MTRRAWFVRGIRDKLVVSFSALILIIAVFVFVFFPGRLERQAMRTVITKAATIRDLTAYSLSAGLVFGDTASIDEVLTGAMRDKDVRLLLVQDATGRVVARRGAEVPGSSGAGSRAGGVTPDGRAYVTSGPVLREGRPIGTLVVGVSLAELRQDVASARLLGALVGSLIFVLGLVIAYAISTLVTRQLTAVSETVQRIAAGDLSLRAADASDVEVAEFVRAFNHMVDTVAAAQHELAGINRELETRVATRTAEARATSEMLQSLIDVAPEAIIAVDLEWLVTRWNAAATQLFGWTAEEVLGKPLPHLPADATGGFVELREQAEPGHAVSARELVRLRKDGTSVTVLFSAAVLRDRHQSRVGYIAMLTDLTERKSLEEQLRQSQKMEAIGRLAGGVAHDFNNILTVITSSAGFLLDNKPDEQARRDLEQIATAAARAASLTRQLLTFSRKQIVNLQLVEVNAVMRQIEPMLRRLLRANIDLRAQLDEESAFVTADPVQLEQVLMNLVVNASDAMPAGGSLRIETRNVVLDEARAREHAHIAPGRFVLISVTDTGVGMDAAITSRIFEPFFTTKDVGQGTGLGLAIAYAVVNQLGGSIEVHSEVGHGTEFRILIPRVHAEPPKVTRLTPVSTAAVVHGRETILLVEDEETVRRVVRRTLERAGYTVLEASDGESGLTVAGAHPTRIDAVVTDLMMPGMNGRAFADAVTAAYPSLKVVFISGYADETVEQGGMNDETHAFVQKPFTGPQLLKVLEELLREPAESAAPS
jgi:PAS domain S-box-containing protein